MEALEKTKKLLEAEQCEASDTGKNPLPKVVATKTPHLDS